MEPETLVTLLKLKTKMNVLRFRRQYATPDEALKTIQYLEGIPLSEVHPRLRKSFPEMMEFYSLGIVNINRK